MQGGTGGRETEGVVQMAVRERWFRRGRGAARIVGARERHF